MSPSWCLIFIMFFGWTSDDACGYSCFYHANVPFSAPCVQRTPAVTTQMILETTSSMLWLRRIHLLPLTMFWLISFDYLGDQEKGIYVLFFFSYIWAVNSLSSQQLSGSLHHWTEEGLWGMLADSFLFAYCLKGNGLNSFSNHNVSCPEHSISVS